MGGKILRNIFIILILFFAYQAASYDNLKTHPLLSETAITIYNQQAGQKLTGQQTAWIIKGSIDEDNDPRYLNHFYNPTTGKGLDSLDRIGKLSFKVQGKSAKEWAKNQNSATGDYSEPAILKNYQDGNLTRAYQGVGHILHLIQDMAVPAHTRNDPHGQGDPYEKWAERYGAINPSKLSFLNINSLDQAFDQMANYSNNNFFSSDSVNISKTNNYKIESLIDNNKKKNYLLSNINGINYKLCYTVGLDWILSKCYVDDDFKLNLDYWNMLYPRAVGYNAGVIDYFVKQFEQIDKFKKEQEQISAWGKLKNYFVSLKSEVKYSWGDVFMSQRNVLASGYGIAAKLAGKTQDNFQNFSDANREIVEQAAKQAGQVLSAFEQAGSAEEIFKPQPTKAENTAATDQIILTQFLGAGQTTANSLLEAGQKISSAPFPPERLASSRAGPPERLPARQGHSGGVSSSRAGVKEGEIQPPAALNIRETEMPNSPAPLSKEGQLSAGKTASTFIFVAGDSRPPETSIISAPGQIINLSSAAFIFTSSEANSSFECNLDNASWQGCSLPNNFTSLADGNHIFKVRARDAVNNIDQTPAEHSWIVDTTAPQVTIISGPPDVASSTTANFQFASSENETAYQCQIDANPWQTCSALTTAADLIEGRHSLAIKGADLAGNIGSSTIKIWLVDSTAPTSTAASLGAVYEATGFTVSWSGMDADATGATTTVSGLADFTAHYKIGVGGWQNWINSTTSTSTIFNLAVASGQTVYFRVKARDLAGNIGGWGAETQTKIDNHIADHIVISEVQVSGASAADEFVELYNPTNSEINLSSYSIQYRGSGALSFLKKNFLAGAVIKSKAYYLITSNQYAGSVYANMAHASFDLSGAGGTIFLVNNNITLTDNSATSTDVVDHLAYGSGSYLFPEGAVYLNVPAAGQSLERKTLAASTAGSMSTGADKLSGNSYDSNNNSADFILRTSAESQNSDSSSEPASSTPLLPGVISNLAAIQASTTASSIVLKWLSPENAKLNYSAYYEIKYKEKNGNCSLQLNWNKAISVASSSRPVPSEVSGAAELVQITGVSANTEYCLAIRTFNGSYWSNLSNQISALTSQISQNIIALGNTSFALSNWKQRFTWKHTVAGNDPVLLVSLHGDGDYLNSNSVTYNGQPLILAIKKIHGNPYNNIAVSIYYLAKPSPGEHDIAVNVGWTVPYAASAATFLNCDITNPIGLANSFFEGVTPMSHSVATNFAGMMLVDAVTYNRPVVVSIAPAAGQTQYFEQTPSGTWSGQTNDLYAGESYKLTGPAGSYSMGWVTSVGRSSVQAIVALNPKP